MRTWLWNRQSLVTEMSEVSGQRFRHSRLDFFPGLSQGEHPLYVGHVSAPTTIVGLLVDHEIVRHRRSSNPVALRIAASVPAGTESEFLLATVTIRRPSGLRHISWEPRLRRRRQLASFKTARTSRNFFATARAAQGSLRKAQAGEAG